MTATRRPVLGFIGIHSGAATDRPTSQDETVADLFARDGYEVHRASPYRARWLRTLHQIFATLSWRSIDVLVIAVFSWRSFWIADFASALSRPFRRRKVVLFLHGGELPVFAAAHPRWVRRVFDRADLIVAPSRYLAEAFDGWGYDIGTIPNVVELDRYHYRRRDRPAPALLWMRAFHENYDPFMALDVLARLASDLPEVTMTMGGVDLGLLEATKQRAHDLGLSDRVHFAGYLVGEAKVRAMADHDIFLNTNAVDNMPISVIEAAASGLVPVSTSVGGIPALLTDDVNACLVDSGDDGAMAVAILRLLAEPARAQRLSEGARDLATDFDWPAVAGHWSSAFRQLGVSEGTTA